jgi:G3E family GTPase
MSKPQNQVNLGIILIGHRNQQHTMNSKHAIILTGFLGAGKTTFLNHYLKTQAPTRYAIIENEFGEQGIDGEVLTCTTDSLVTMNNGCLCCTLNSNLYDILSELDQSREAFDALIIEATGVADPAGIAQPFLIHPAIRKAFALQHVVCLVDALHLESQLADTEETQRQIAFSNILLLNKTDLVSQEKTEALKALLQKINPWALVLEGNHHRYPVLPQGSFMDNVSTNTAAHHHHHKDLSTLSFSYTQAFKLDTLRFVLQQFLMFQAKSVYRTKGIIQATDGQHYLVQSVGQQLSITPLAAPTHSGSRMVFIGKNLQPKGYDRMLQGCLAKT